MKKTRLSKWQIFTPNQKVEIMADFPAEKVQPDEKYFFELVKRVTSSCKGNYIAILDSCNKYKH
jgi:hypothetical protein